MTRVGCPLLTSTNVVGLCDLPVMASVQGCYCLVMNLQTVTSSTVGLLCEPNSYRANNYVVREGDLLVSRTIKWNLLETEEAGQRRKIVLRRSFDATT